MMRRVTDNMDLRGTPHPPGPEDAALDIEWASFRTMRVVAERLRHARRAQLCVHHYRPTDDGQPHEALLQPSQNPVRFRCSGR
jgi:hypothetical protein